MAGIPNITGNYYAHAYSIWKSSENGLFTASMSSNTYPGTSHAGTGYAIAAFDASKASTTYGNSDTVTPLSLSTKFFIKY